MKRLAAITTVMTLALASTAACSSDPEEGGGGDKIISPRTPPQISTISVMSRNLYIGADVDTVILALASPDPTDDKPAMLAAVETFLATDFTARAAALSAEIARAQPDIVGLQEVWQVALDLPGAGELEVDFLTVLLGSLKDLGLDYSVAIRLEASHTVLPGIELMDTDAILVRTGRASVTSKDGKLFQANLGDIGAGFDLVRGWTCVDVEVDGRPVQLINTHLESGEGELLSGLRALQATEAVSLARTDVPVIIVGDLNDVPGSPMHQVLSEAGFVDTWTALRGEAPGETCCHATDLSDQSTVLDQRIDYILARGFEGEHTPLRGTIRRLGYREWETVPGPAHDLWASDHLGLAADLSYPTFF